MKKILYIIFLLLFALSCRKKDENAVLSGTTTIDNILYGTGPYFAMGFSVTSGKNVSTLDSPLDAITIMADYDINYNVRKIYFATNNFFYSFFRFGQYSDENAASLAFNNLTSFTDPSWTELGDSVKANQIWLYKTNSAGFAKLRIISTVSEKRDNKPFAGCTFEWIYQPDGSFTFPGK
jgi:hypothetical protein